MKIFAAYLLPELWLCLWGFVILTLDFLTSWSKRTLGWLAAFGMFVATVLVGVQGQLVNQMSDQLAQVQSGIGLWLKQAIVADSFALFFKFAICLAVFLVILSALDYAQKNIRHFQGEFYAFIVFAALSMCFMACSVELITLFLAIEFTSISSYILAAYLRDDPKSAEAGMKYFLVGATTTAATLYGMSLIYGLTGTTHIYEIAKAVGTMEANPLLILAVVLMLASLGFKVAMVPFHGWCPDAYEGAPTPITSFLSVASKAAGFAIFVRILVMGFGDLGVGNPNWQMTIAFLSAVTMTVGNLIAIPQTNIKRMLAYSSIAQVGYMLIAIASFTDKDWQLLMGQRPLSFDDMALPGLLFFVLAYLFAKAGAFAVVIIVSNAIGSDRIDDYSGLMRRCPLAAVLLVVFFLSLIGIPPFAGFFAKLMVFGGAIYRDMTWLAVLGILNSVVSVYYYMEVARRMFFFPPRDERPIESTRALNTVLWLTLAGTLLLGVFPTPIIEWAHQSIEGVLEAGFALLAGG